MNACCTVRGALARTAWAAGVHNYKRLLFLVEFHVEVHVEMWKLCRMTTVTMVQMHYLKLGAVPRCVGVCWAADEATLYLILSLVRAEGEGKFHLEKLVFTLPVNLEKEHILFLGSSYIEKEAVSLVV